MTQTQQLPLVDIRADHRLAMVEVYEAEWIRASDRYDREPCDIHRKIEEARWNDYMTAKLELGLCVEANCQAISDCTYCADHAPDGAELS